ncbi:type ISP restriction/modification enzyme [Taklimakanibacter lacteus]|uniref:type ISP restriction/modification enzyme n=1 Tax=Taklimakanibacter lacteus TaxID=2268456 RepID=UPI000E675516
MFDFKTYLSKLDEALRANNATEHTHRPALKQLLEGIRDLRATNEPSRIECGAPDFIITKSTHTIGYIEVKDVGKSLDDAEQADQLKRYRKSLSNLILSDYLEFRWYVDGELRQEARLASRQSNGTLKVDKAGVAKVEALLNNFLNQPPIKINAPRDLAERMARLTHIVRDIIVTAFEKDIASDWVKGWRKAFSDVLIADLDQAKNTPQFADMFAQTLAYGIFTARVMADPGARFTREEAQRLIPRSNPFLRNFFIDISNPRLDDEPFACFVDDLVALLGNTDMATVLANFGHRTKQEDPVVHFYETFLAAYDPKLRETRGVYYTPEPVVSYIVRSVDNILKTQFDCPTGLADQSMITIKNLDQSLRVKGKNSEVRKTTQSHKVIILDPATGTGTFLYSVVDFIRQQFIASGNAGMWPGYVKRHLLPRLFGFEFMVAPFAVAHFKLSLQLAGRDLAEDIRDQWAVLPEGSDRLGVFLTNTLDEAHEHTAMPLFTQWVAQESAAADAIKMHSPVLVVMGNPPYSGHSANHGQWIDDLLHGAGKDKSVSSYYHVDGQPLGERNSKWLQDDYVKFLCFGQWRIERSGQGILAYITNHGFLNNPTFRGMRQSLMNTFSEIHVLDLHGSVKKRARNPSGETDQNVFDIQQGVSIGIFIKHSGKSGPAKVFHADLWGSRAEKYNWLFEKDQGSTEWEELTPQAPFYLFKPLDTTSLAVYQAAWKITDIFPVNVLGFQTHRDHFAVGFDYADMENRFREMRSAALSDDEYRERFKLRDNRDWNLADARKALRSDADWQQGLVDCLYRPFDWRTCYFSEVAMDYPRREIRQHVLGKNNICILTSRQQADAGFMHVLLSEDPAESCAVSNKTKEQNYVFPLYLYPSAEADAAPELLSQASDWPADDRNGGRTPNLKKEFVAAIAEATGLTFAPAGDVTQAGRFNPPDVLHYIYAILHSGSYRETYSQFLMLDFPRIPVPKSADEFIQVAQLGGQLRSLHLLDDSVSIPKEVRFPVAGDNTVARAHPKFVMEEGSPFGRVYINTSQFFDGIAQEAWDFEIGSYQVLEKWLKDRQGRQLSYDDLTQYQKILGAINGTLSVMTTLDQIIEF